jgi:LysM repeat protein
MTISPSRLVLLATLAAAVPAGVAAQQPASHTVKRGDTLWDLAQRYLGDPFLWPQIYRLNTSVVEDPHWIYPGEVLRLAGGEGVQAVPSEETPAAPRPVAQEGEYPMPEFAQRRPSAQFESLQAYTEQTYRPLRPGAFYSAPWLTEQQQLPSGRLLGEVTPPQIDFIREGAPAMPFTSVGIEPPEGASYAVNDTLQVFLREIGHPGLGELVIPTGLIRITGKTDLQYVGEVIAVYGPMRGGQEVVPVAAFVAGPKALPVPASDTLQGTVLAFSVSRPLQDPLNRLIISVGREHGVAPGDVFEVRRVPGPRPRAAYNEDELMAKGQVVRVGERSATLLLTRIVSPNIPGGMVARRVARLPS